MSGGREKGCRNELRYIQIQHTGLCMLRLFSIVLITYGGRLLQISLHTGVLACITAKNMADAPDERRSSSKQYEHDTLQNRATKYKEWDPAAQTEFKRLFDIDKKTRLTSVANPEFFSARGIPRQCLSKERKRGQDVALQRSPFIFFIRNRLSAHVRLWYQLPQCTFSPQPKQLLINGCMKLDRYGPLAFEIMYSIAGGLGANLSRYVRSERLNKSTK